ncbi:MAG: rhodanese-like domain-containing protein [Jatrophihabitantaceae bacterium]
MNPTPADRAAAVAHFRAKLSFETDPSDVAAALATGDPGFVLIDTRSEVSWRQGHVPGAKHLPTAEIGARAARELAAGTPLVTYCWGPGCNGSTRAALALSELGFAVQEMIGGFKYWSREGLPVQTSDAIVNRPTDPLTAPLSAASCDC